MLPGPSPFHTVNAPCDEPAVSELGVVTDGEAGVEHGIHRGASVEEE